MSWQKALHVQTTGCCCWREDDPIKQLVLYEKTLVGWMPGSWTQKGWDCFGWWFLRLGGLGGGVILAEGLHDWGMRAMPLLNYTPAFALQLSHIPRCVAAVALGVSEALAAFALQRPFWSVVYVSTFARSQQRSVTDRTLATSGPRATDTMRYDVRGRSFSGSWSRRFDRS
jgi:hypothetical protein